MPLPWWLEKQFHNIVDFWSAVRPQPIPPKAVLAECKIVSHRGEHDNTAVYENTLPAFDQSAEAGVWGLELDIRWTKDLHPVVCHDPDLKRLFNIDRVISEATLEEILTAAPLVPSLAKVIERYGKRMHLMVEIKEERYPDPEVQNQKLAALFAGLIPGEDFHFLTLTPLMFRLIRFVPPIALLPVARLEVKDFSDLALREGMGGLNGHYLLMTKRILEKHRRKKQHIGTGYIRSKNCLFREINRGVEWIFSNHAVRMQAMIDHLTQP